MKYFVFFVLKEIFLILGHRYEGTLQNYNPVPTIDKQAEMAMAIANAGQEPDTEEKSGSVTQNSMHQNEEIQIDYDIDAGAGEELEKHENSEQAQSVRCMKNPKRIKLDDQDDEQLTQGANSNVTDPYTLFMLREQQLAAQRQRLFASKFSKK